MPSKIIFPSAVLRSFGRTSKGMGTAHFSSSITAAISKAMDWDTSPVPDFLSSAHPDGELAAQNLELVPADKEFSKHTVELECSRVHKFEIVRLELENQKGKGHRLELRFVVVFTDTSGCKKLEQYMLTIGEGKSKLNVSYSKQEILPGMVPEEQAADTAEEND